MAGVYGKLERGEGEGEGEGEVEVFCKFQNPLFHPEAVW